MVVLESERINRSGFALAHKQKENRSRAPGESLPSNRYGSDVE